MSTIKANAFLDASGGNTAQINGITPAIASQAQAEAGTDDTVLMTPLKLRKSLNAAGNAPTYACRAWVNFNGTGSVAIRASGNVSSVTDNGVGEYTINFATPLEDANYTWAGGGNTGSSVVDYRLTVQSRLGDTKTASALQITTMGGRNETTLFDASEVNVIVFR